MYTLIQSILLFFILLFFQSNSLSLFSFVLLRVSQLRGSTRCLFAVHQYLFHSFSTDEEVNLYIPLNSCTEFKSKLFDIANLDAKKLLPVKIFAPHSTRTTVKNQENRLKFAAFVFVHPTPTSLIQSTANGTEHIVCSASTISVLLKIMSSMLHTR